MTLRLSNLSAGYDRHPVVHHISGVFQTGSMTAVVGPNGGGKSTLLKTLVGFVPIMTGEVDFDGIKPAEIAYLPQQFEMDRTFPLSVLDVVLLGHWQNLGAMGRLKRRHKDEAIEALAQVDMESFVERPVISLSTGQWQRVLFARLCLQRAKLILLDEPFAAIDDRTTHDLVHMLERWSMKGSTVVCVLHDFNLVRGHFPQSLLLAREMVSWGNTKEVMGDQNLARASALASKWVDHADVCDVGERGAA